MVNFYLADLCIFFVVNHHAMFITQGVSYA